MSTGVRCWGLIPAAGVGRRFGAEVPKQYLALAGRPVIDHAIGAFVAHPGIAGCAVVLGAEDGWWADVSAYAGHPRVLRAPGGAERCHSVRNGLEALAQRAADEDWVLVHDAARPCLRRTDLDRLLEALQDEPVGALLAVPIADTVKRADAGQVAETLPRSALWRAYTPQAFRLGLLRRALDHAATKDLIVTDDASAVELLGLRPALVECSADNIKITRPEDLPLAAFYLEQQRETPC
ncbi:2-C-methyl-D-erythritol 4-phosphate cytidylyltransferase [uncultured Thiohalocapsa sp.]|uniref:2-C-methyl-D-erythritol 4-phosphate cytidylyltransferase n=1 Tax=uncultured Thiohalocapsa sp. TaxID=768990 RepID=UPI0025D84E45|nr:2-C-methyl-D-erythritol 4-phosphate cytidylyltransferase [uncultured Thiohalocapsa sp.]